MEDIARAICNELGASYVDSVGAGAYKQTYHVISKSGDAQALKLFQNANSPERTKRELEAMLRCDHHGVVKLIAVDVVQIGNASYLYTLEDYLPGGSLSKKVVNGPLTLDQAFRLGESLIEAIGHIASHNLVHRDLKPDNIMFLRDSVTPVIVDFGIVRDLSNTSLTMDWVASGPGTPFFAAPEQLTNNKNLIDWRTDQFALAVVMAVCVLGRHPYAEDGDDVGSTLQRVVNHRGPSLRFQSEISAFGLPIVSKMAAPWPVERFRTPDDLLNAWRSQKGASV